MKAIKFKFDYADEFDVEGVKITSDEECEEYLEMIDHLDKLPYFIKQEIEIYYGSNEFFTLCNFSRDDIKVIDITDSEFKTFQKIFGNKTKYGMSLNIENCAHDIIYLITSEEYKYDFALELGEKYCGLNEDDVDEDTYDAAVSKTGVAILEEEIVFWEHIERKVAQGI